MAGDDTVRKATGQDLEGLAVMAGGALLGGSFVVPFVTRSTGVSAPVGGLLVGGGVAMFADGNLKKAGQGLALVSVIGLAGNLFRNGLGGGGGFGTQGGNRSQFSSGV